MIKVRFFTLLHLLLNRREMELVSVPGEQVDGLLARLQEQIEIPFLHKLTAENGELKVGTIIMVNGKHVLHLDGLKTPLNDGDEVALFPPGGGG
jgi:molybdopterin synthase sulfur carrier subunit